MMSSQNPASVGLQIWQDKEKNKVRLKYRCHGVTVNNF